MKEHGMRKITWMVTSGELVEGKRFDARWQTHNEDGTLRAEGKLVGAWYCGELEWDDDDFDGVADRGENGELLVAHMTGGRMTSTRSGERDMNFSYYWPLQWRVDAL